MYDEAGDFSRKSTLTRFNKILNDVFSQFRAFNIMIILALPNFTLLDNTLFLNKVPTGLFHCKERSYGYGRLALYGRKELSYIRSYMKETVYYEDAYNREQPNMVSTFLDLSPERSRKLDTLSTLRKQKTLMKSVVSLQGLLDYEDIANKIGMSKPWVKLQIAKRKLKHELVHNKKKYFGQDIITKLQKQ
jgi:hypothetical protein